MEAPFQFMTERLNIRLAKAMSLPEGTPFLDEEGRIDMWMFSQKNGGKFPDEGEGGIMMDERRVYEKKTGSIARSEKMQQYFGGLEKAYRHLEQSRWARDGELGEKALFYLLNRFLGRRYFVLRTSLHDDLENKADFLIVDSKGTERGAFVVDMFVSDDPMHPKEVRKASEKTKSLSKKRGNHLKYGICPQKNGGLERSSLDGLPGIVIPVEMGALKSFYDDLTEAKPFDAKPTDAEWRLFESVIHSFAVHLPSEEELKTERLIPLLEFLQSAGRRLDHHDNSSL